MNMIYSIEDIDLVELGIDDYDTFGRLPISARERIVARIQWIRLIEKAAHGEKGEVAAIAARELGLSEVRIGHLRREYLAKGWTALIDGRRGRASALPDAFKGFVASLHLQCQRSGTGREVHRMLVERWRLWLKTGDAKWAIPGYETPPPAGPNGYPDGWSENNILRMRPDDYSLTAVRQGEKAAYKLLPSILKTRVGLRFGQVIFCDDQDYDVKIMPRGSGNIPLRPQGFNFLDYLSGSFVHHVIRLRWWDEGGEKYRTLTQKDFTWALIAHLQRNGYRRDKAGTTFVMEHGTATGFDNQELATFGGHHSLDEALRAVSGGCIEVIRSGRFNSPVFAGMLFRPASSGNPNFKSPLESMFNMVRNRMAALPGAIGRNHDLKPAEQYGLDLYAGQMMKLYNRLDERHRAAMTLPMLTPEEFGEAAEAIYGAINSRTEHSLEGWEQLGFMEPQMRFTPDGRSPWLGRSEVAALLPESREALLALTVRPGHTRAARLSPADVARQCSGELTKLPDHLVPFLVPIQWARPATVKANRTVAIQDQLLGPEPLTYVCRIADANGGRVLAPDTRILCYLNPFDCDRLIVCSENGSYLGTLRRQTRAGFTDHDAVIAQLKERAELKADLDTGVRPLVQGLISHRAEMKRVNGRLAEGLPVLPDEVDAARSESARAGVRTRKANEIADALGDAGLSPSLLLGGHDDPEEPCGPDAGTFSYSKLLTQTNDDSDEY